MNAARNLIDHRFVTNLKILICFETAKFSRKLLLEVIKQRKKEKNIRNNLKVDEKKIGPMFGIDII